MGVPLINAIYENDPLVGMYTLPLLIWHPMQLVVGSFLAPKLNRWVQAEKERLGIGDNEEKEATTKDEEDVPSEESPLMDETTISEYSS
jgi:sodium/bile acid cotransporter 7